MSGALTGGGTHPISGKSSRASCRSSAVLQLVLCVGSDVEMIKVE